MRTKLQMILQWLRKLWSIRSGTVIHNTLYFQFARLIKNEYKQANKLNVVLILVSYISDELWVSELGRQFRPQNIKKRGKTHLYNNTDFC